MRIKAAQLREKTLQRVSKLKSDKTEAEEAARLRQLEELDARQRSQALVQADDYVNKMTAMKKETARRMRARRQAEEDRLGAEKKNMNQKLSAISDARRRVDRELPQGYAPPAHTHKNGQAALLQRQVRQVRTASPVGRDRQGDRRASQRESRDDAGFSPHTGGDSSHSNNGGYSYAHNNLNLDLNRSPSPVVEVEVESWQDAPPAMLNARQVQAQVQQHSPAGVAPEPPKRAPRAHNGHSSIPAPSRVMYRGGSTGADDEDALSDDSLGGGGGPPPVHEDQFAASPTRLLGAGAGAGAGGARRSLDEDMSVLTTDSPQRQRQHAGARGGAGGGMGGGGGYGARHLPPNNSAGIPETNSRRKKKVWRALKPLAIGEYSSVPLPQDGSVSER